MPLQFFVPIHGPDGKSQQVTALDRAILDAQKDGVKVNDAVRKKWAPAGYARETGGAPFEEWLEDHGLELCKSDRSGAWWTVVKSVNVTKRDSSGIAINAADKFAYPN
jgi:hypothetical protein